MQIPKSTKQFGNRIMNITASNHTGYQLDDNFLALDVILAGKVFPNQLTNVWPRYSISDADHKIVEWWRTRGMDLENIITFGHPGMPCLWCS